MWFWALVIIGGVWWITKKAQSPTSSLIYKDFTEDNVIEAQRKFEKSMIESDGPVGIGYQQTHIYYLLRGWFEKLCAQNRYKDDMLQRLRSDWMTYLNALEAHRIDVYLWMETDREDKEGNDYREEELRMSGMKVKALEDGIAAAMGEEAVKELERKRNMDQDRFGPNGKTAPKRKRYSILGDLMDE